MAAFDADALIEAYRAGVFPMADGRDEADFYLVDPTLRGVIPLESFHVPRRLARVVRSDRFAVSLDTDFAAVLDACAAPAPGREETWISAPIRRLYLQLHARGLAHSLECRRDGVLVGGLYGVAIAGAFFGESMFSRPALGGSESSKVALVHLVARMRAGGFTLLDTQFLTEHLAGFGAVEIARADYRARLKAALAQPGDLYVLDAACASSAVGGAGLGLTGLDVADADAPPSVSSEFASAALGSRAADSLRRAGGGATGAPTGAEILQLISQRS